MSDPDSAAPPASVSPDPDVRAGLHPRSELAKRVVTAAVLAVVALGCLVAGGTAFFVLLAITALLAAAEWGGLCGGWRHARWASLAAVAAVGGALAYYGYILFGADFAPGWTGIAAIFSLLALLPLSLGAGLCCVPFGWRRALSLGCGLPYVYTAVPVLLGLRLGFADGFLLVLFLLLIVWTTDTAAFFVGRQFGGPKLAPRISPKKTWSGFVGGVSGSALVAAGFGLWLAAGQRLVPGADGLCADPAMAPDAVAIRAGWALVPLLALVGAGLSVASQMGDLFESWAKRVAGVKDSGRLLPGHGGVLDRIDGLLFAAPLFGLILVAARMLWLGQVDCPAGPFIP